MAVLEERGRGGGGAWACRGSGRQGSGHCPMKRGLIARFRARAAGRPAGLERSFSTYGPAGGRGPQSASPAGRFRETRNKTDDFLYNGDVAPLQDRPIDRTTLILVTDEGVLERFAGVVRYLQVGLIDEPFQTILVAPEHPRARLLDAGPTPVVSYRTTPRIFSRWENQRTLAAIGQRIAEFRHDSSIVVHALTGACSTLAKHIADELDGRLVVTLSSRAECDDPQVRELLGQADRVTVPSLRLIESLSRSPVANRPTVVVSFGVPAQDAPSAFRDPDRRKTLIYVGPLTADSGCDDLLRACKSVLRFHPDMLVFLAGKGPEESALRHLADELGIAANVTFTGRLEHWQSAMDAADMFCLPTASGEVRDAPLHALADGSAVIAAADSAYDCMIDGQTAHLFSEGDTSGLADRIRRLIEDRDAARALAATAQSHMREHYSIGRMVSEFARLYQELVASERVVSTTAAAHQDG